MNCNVRRASAAEWKWYREQNSDTAVAANVIEILNRVKADGDRAVLEYTAKFDHVDLAGTQTGLRVPQEYLERAYRSLSDDLKAALANAADRIRHFHALQRRGDIRYTGVDGEELGLVWRPLHRVGVYAPGGRAAYPSTVLMNVIPAQVAGVDEIVLVSPPQPETGWPHELVLAAAHLLGVNEVYRVGGAQAVAALAYGTETVAKVDKIVGPGNAYVAYAKRLVAGDVGTDSIAGPSEVFIVADDSANPDYVAADLLAQAEHDPEAGAVCISTHAPLLDAVQAALEVQLEQLPRREIARQSLERWGALVLADNLQQAVDVVDRFAPEHVELMVRDPEVWLDRLRTPGAVFLGHHTPESVGDYYAGTNHVLPTFGTGRFSSGLGVDDFLRRMSYVKYDAATLAAHAADICALADAEGLDAHKHAVEIRVAKGETRS